MFFKSHIQPLNLILIKTRGTFCQWVEIIQFPVQHLLFHAFFRNDLQISEKWHLRLQNSWKKFNFETKINYLTFIGRFVFKKKTRVNRLNYLFRLFWNEHKIQFHKSREHLRQKKYSSVGFTVSALKTFINNKVGKFVSIMLLNVILIDHNWFVFQ